MVSCSKYKVSVSQNETCIQFTTGEHVLQMKCSKINAESLNFMKFKMERFYCEECTRKLEQRREKTTPIKTISETKGR